MGAKAPQGPLTLAGGREDDGGWLRGLGCVEVLLQELAPTKPHLGILPGKLVLQLVEMGQEGLHRGVPGGWLGLGGWVDEEEYAEDEQ